MISILVSRAVQFDEYTGLVSVVTTDAIYEFKATSRCHSIPLVFIHIHQRQEYDEWFGFVSKQERELFRDLLKVQKIGPSTALSIVEVFRDKALISDASVKELQQVKGVGFTTAQTIHDHFHGVRVKKVKNV